MSKPRSGAPKRVAAGLIASALAVTGLAFAPSAGATASVTTERFNGDTRWDTAKLISQDEAFAAPKSVIVAGGGNNRFPDSLAASVHAGTTGQTPIVLTETAQLTKQASDALTALKAKGVSTATVVGGTVAVSDATVNAIKALGLTVTRIAGTGDSADRYGTAAAVATAANAAKATGTINGVKAAFIATGLNFPDAIAAAPAAYAGRIPVLLVNSDVPAVTQKAITDLGIKKAYILGGTNAVSEAVAAKIAAATGSANTRLEGTVATGQDRFGTAAVIADFEVANLGFVPTAAILANGTDAKGGLDALASGPLGGELKAPVLLTASLPKATRDWLDAHSNTISKIYASGGTGVIDDATLTAAQTAAQTVSNDTNQSYSVTPADAATLPFSATPSAASTRTFTATVPAGTKANIVLLPAANVTVNSTNGTVTFADAADSNNIADPGTPVATITSVNGVPGAPTANIVSGGAITFTITSTGAADVIPVVFTDTDSDGNLDLVAANPANASPKAPAEPVGIGGRTTFVPAEQAFGSFTATTVTAANTAQDYFVAGSTLYYDANDVFQYGGVPITMAQFEGLLNAGDVVSGSYAPEPSGVSTLNVNSPENVAAPTAPAAPLVTGAARNLDSGTTTNDVVLNWTRSAQADVTTYRVVRDVDSDGATGVGDVVVAPAATGTTLTLSNEPVDADVEYLIYALGGTTGVASTPLSTGNLNVGSAVTAAPAPLAIDALQTTTAGFGGTFDTGDVFKVVFDTAIAAPASGATLRLTDSDPTTATVADVVNGTNATFTVNVAAETVNGLSRAAGTVLTVTLTGTPSTITNGTVAGLQAGATITDQSGILSTAGANWNVTTGGQDVIVDQDSADNTTGVAITATSVSPTTGPSAGNTPVTITGTNFSLSGATVTFGGVAATSVVVVNSTTITAVTPAHAAGAVDVVVTSGGSNATMVGGYTYA